MFTFIIEGTLKPGKKTEFTAAWNKEILPTLKKQAGFVDEILLFSVDEPNRGVGLSIWKNREDAEKYRRDVFPRMLNSVQQFIEVPPTMRGFDIEASQTLNVAAGKAA